MDFVRTAQELLTDALRADLKNLQGFAFKSHPTIALSQGRLNALSSIVNDQIKRILGR